MSQAKNLWHPAEQDQRWVQVNSMKISEKWYK